MNKAIGFLLPLVVMSPLAAQTDTIYWTDGTQSKKVKVTAFSLREIKFRSRGSSESRSSDLVARLDVTKVNNKFVRAFNSPRDEQAGNFLREADKLASSDPFLAQFAFVEAAKVFLANAQYNDAFQVLEQLNQKCPDSGFMPLLYQTKLEYYTARRRQKDMRNVADKYTTAVQTQGYPDGYGLEAEYYARLADGLSKGASAIALRSAMLDVAGRAESAGFPGVADKARLQVAHALLAEGNVDAAKGAFIDLKNRNRIDAGVLAGAWLGLGKVHMKRGDPANREPYREALLAFLHVYVENKQGGAVVAEALDLGAQAAEKGGGDDSTRMKGRLRSLLRRQFPDYK